MSLTPTQFDHLDQCYRHAKANPDSPWTHLVLSRNGSRTVAQLAEGKLIEVHPTTAGRAKITAAGEAAWKAHRRTMMPAGITIVRGTSVCFGGRRIGWLHRTGAGRGMSPRWYTEDEAGSFASEHVADRIEAVRMLMRHLGMVVPGEE